MSFNPLYFGSAFDVSESPTIVSSDIPLGFPVITRPPSKRVSFTEHLILYGIIRRPFTEDFRLAGSIVKPFMDNIVFSATAVKRLNEVCLLAGYILTEDIPSEAWERLFEEVEE